MKAQQIAAPIFPSSVRPLSRATTLDAVSKRNAIFFGVLCGFCLFFLKSSQQRIEQQMAVQSVRSGLLRTSIDNENPMMLQIEKNGADFELIGAKPERIRLLVNAASAWQLIITPSLPEGFEMLIQVAGTEARRIESGAWIVATGTGQEQLNLSFTVIPKAGTNVDRFNGYHANVSLNVIGVL